MRVAPCPRSGGTRCFTSPILCKSGESNTATRPLIRPVSLDLLVGYIPGINSDEAAIIESFRVRSVIKNLLWLIEKDVNSLVDSALIDHRIKGPSTLGVCGTPSLGQPLHNVTILPVACYPAIATSGRIV